MAEECVIIIHGFARSSSSMKKIKSYLDEKSYNTILIDYPTRKYHLNELVEKIIYPKIKDKIHLYKKIHFVGYSMGGIIVRYIIHKYNLENIGRIILIGSPNAGSEIVNAFGKYKWFENIFGPSVMDLGSDTDYMNLLPQEIDCEIGIISGNFSINPFTSLFILNGEDDGIVDVESTKHKSMKDQIIVSSTHFMLPYNNEVIEQTEYFLSHGKFRH